MKFDNATALESYFDKFRSKIIGSEETFDSSYGKQKLIYADWIATGRLYAPIEEKIIKDFAPFYANTHSYSSETGKITSHYYERAREIIKEHVNANNEDILVTTGSGMTAALAKLQRLMGLRKDQFAKGNLGVEERPVVFISHMEHHSNYAPWFECRVDVVIIPPNEKGLIDCENLEKQLLKYKHRKIKIGSFTACSNVTGLITDYHSLARKMHEFGGKCFIDFAASAPYVKMDMHPDEASGLDAIFFSPHKFLGGPGSCGILVFNKELYQATFPDKPGGGNIKWTTPWKNYNYFEDIERKEDGGTPSIIQTVRAALAVKLKEKMGVENMQVREDELLQLFESELSGIHDLHILGNRNCRRIGSVAFNLYGIHYNLVVRLLNDRFGIQSRGGWSCASTYAHFLFDIDPAKSAQVMAQIERKDLTNKPGWVRISLHPVMSNKEVLFICDAIKQIVCNGLQWKKDYTYNPSNNEFEPNNRKDNLRESIAEFFSFSN